LARKAKNAALEPGQVILTGQFEQFREQAKQLVSGRRGRQISEEEFETFTDAFLAIPIPEAADTIYGRAGFVVVNRLDHDLFQLMACQINSFGPGVFAAERVRYQTPILLTVQVKPRRRHAPYTLRETPLQVTDIYLSRRFCGSKGNLCKRELFLDQVRRVLLHDAAQDSGKLRLFYEVANTNYLCHHIAETLGYALCGLEMFWENRRASFLMLAGSRYEEAGEKLHLEIVDDFAGEKMQCRFKIPRYKKLDENPAAFREPYEPMLAEVAYRSQTELFSMPVGFQRMEKSAGRISYLTTQHLLQHLMKEYYHRSGIAVVASTFSTLAYLTRAFIARRDGHPERCAAFMRRFTTCLGYYPERDFAEFWREKEKKFERYDTDVDTAMFFRSPVIL